jgi:hypothetical protein
LRTHLFYTFTLLVGLMLASAGLWAQTPALPTETGTSTLPTNGTATLPDGGEQDTEDPSATPPPTVTPTLPASAKRSDVMVKRGAKELELRFAYSHFSKNSLFIDGVAMLPILVVGEVAVEQVRRDVLIASVAGRYGLRDNLEVEVKVPFRYQYETRDVPQASPPQQISLSALGMGDIEGGVYAHLPARRKDGVRWIANASVKSATGKDIFSIDPDSEIAIGTGFWSTRVGITGVNISDPGAVFWSAGYTYNWLRTNIRVVSEDAQTGDLLVNYVDIKPGNTFDIGAGFAYAINPRMSVNTGMSISFNGPTKSNGRELANTRLTSAALRLGAVWLTEKKFPVDLAVSIGLTDDSPDFTVDWRQSYKF